MYRMEPSRMRHLFKRDEELLRSPERCRELQLLWLEHGDKAARDRLFRALMWYALSPRHVIRACSNRRAYRDELESDIAIACLKTIELWDPSRGANIWTTVCWQRMGAISATMTSHPVKFRQNAVVQVSAGKVVSPSHAAQFELDEMPDDLRDVEADTLGRQMVSMIPEAVKRIGWKRYDIARAVVDGEVNGATLQETADSLGVTRQRVHVVRVRLFAELRAMAGEAA